jgi:Family of unknown function (DUF6113)
VTTVHDDELDGPPVPSAGNGPVVRVMAYLLLFVLGALQALIGTFQYSRGPAWSLVAVCFALAILATCVLGGWGMHAAAGGVLPAAGWFLVSVLLGTSSSGGSVLVTNTPQGKWFLFGGAVCAAAGAIISFAKWTRPRARRRAGS